MGLLDHWRRQPATVRQPSLPEGVRLYAIGDIHGRDDLLEELHRQVTADATGFAGRRWLVYLGDYIDRGAQSYEVVERLLQRPLDGFDSVHLRGNHEQALLDFIAHPQAASGWLGFGGRETLESYGLASALRRTGDDVEALAAALDAVLPDSHREFYTGLVQQWQLGDYHFVHAGVRPGVALDAQDPEDQLWIREEFTESTRDHGAVVVHGHTITPAPEFRANRIGIDTGAFHTGVLTCLVLEGAGRRLLQTGTGPV